MASGLPVGLLHKDLTDSPMPTNDYSRL